MKKISFLIVLSTLISCTDKKYSKTQHKSSAENNFIPHLLLNLPPGSNTPDGATLDKDGNIILSMPNFNNEVLIKSGVLLKPDPEKMVVIDKNNKVADWYIFTEKDKHPETGKIGPMECSFGPDGNLYIADNQNVWNKEHKSRVLRINIKNGKPVNMDVVVEGFIFANGLIWKDSTLFVTESILENIPQNKKKTALLSGVYSFKLHELKKKPLKLLPYRDALSDPHLVAKFKSSNKKGFGADGITFDDHRNLFTSIVEDGVIYKMKLNSNDEITETKIFSRGMTSSDGLVWYKKTNTLYVADFFGNSIYAVNQEGKATQLHKNADTDGKDGSLDQPAALLIRGNELITTNMDVAWMAKATNTKTDHPFTLSVIKLENK